jgi:hypothetical protein
MTPARASSVEHVHRLSEVRALVDAVNQAVYDTVAATPTPRLDRRPAGVSTAVNYTGSNHGPVSDSHRVRRPVSPSFPRRWSR